MNISDETIDNIRQINDIVAIINDYVPLKKRGSNHIGLCPFHNEKTPSFTVNQTKKFFYCFGCHEKGDHITFIQKIETFSFIESIEYLAKKFSIPLIESENKTKFQTNHKLHDCLDTIKNEFKKNLSEVDLMYLKKRSISNQSIEIFEIGSASQDTTLFNKLKSNFHEKEIDETKVFIKTNQGPYNRFKNRLIFPIYNEKKKVIGFGGRTTSEERQQAKYINSEESKLFNKKYVLYGIHLAQKHIKNKNHCIIVEGYIDVILMHQHGFNNTIAIMGTALSNFQAQYLKRQCDTIYLFLDNDQAGRNAMSKSIETLQKHEISTKIVTLDNHKDAAEIAEKNQIEVIDQKLKEAQSIYNFLFNEKYKQINKEEIKEKSNLINEMIIILENEKDPIITDHYLKKFSNILKINPEIPLVKMKKKIYNKGHQFIQENKIKSKFEKIEEYIIYIILSNKKYKNKILEKININNFKNEKIKKIINEIKMKTKYNNELIENIENETTKNELSKLLINSNLSFLDKIDELEVNKFIHIINQKEEDETIKELKNKLKEYEENNNDNKAREIQIKINEILKPQKRSAHE